MAEEINRLNLLTLNRRTTMKAIVWGSAGLLAGLGYASPAYALAQEGWRWCSKCQGMFYGVQPSGDLGVCPAGGRHNPATSAHYYERVEGTISGVQQGGWSWCRKCQGFFYSGTNNMGYCPAGGAHTNNGSAAYAAVIGEDAMGQQGGWRWCSKCQGMFYGRANGGVCPRDHAAHNGGTSAHYASLT